MFKDSRKGWISKLVVGSKVGVKHKGVIYGGTVSLVTALGVLLVRCENNLKFKIRNSKLFCNFALRTSTMNMATL